MSILSSSDPGMRAAVSVGLRVAPAKSTVLITGETGTGKEVLAGEIHRASGRRGALVRVHCAAIPEGLLESELFGHERGAFSGAERLHVGRFEEASGGTLFLDEIAEVRAPLQAKLLRAIEGREFRRVGGTVPLASDVRIIAATNRNLPDAVARGDFREDLFFRLNVIHVHLPPLRERGEADVLALARGFLEELGTELAVEPRVLSDGARDALLAHDWPGNVRELRNAIERALLLGKGVEVGTEALALEAHSAPFRIEGAPVEESLDLAEAERHLVRKALERSDWVQKRAARLLGISPRKLNYLIAKHGWTHPSWRTHVPPDSPEGSAVESGAEVR